MKVGFVIVFLLLNLLGAGLTVLGYYAPVAGVDPRSNPVVALGIMMCLACWLALGILAVKAWIDG